MALAACIRLYNMRWYMGPALQGRTMRNVFLLQDV